MMSLPLSTVLPLSMVPFLSTVLPLSMVPFLLMVLVPRRPPSSKEPTRLRW